MDDAGHVSRHVAFDVSLGVASGLSPQVQVDAAMRDASGAAPEQRAGGRRAAGPGRYLVRQGSVHLFQIRLPEDIGGSPGRLVRISLGAMTARDARVRAELLAALARARFAEIRSKRMKQASDESGHVAWTGFDGETPEITAAEIKAYLKAMQAVLSQPAEVPPHQMPAFAGLRDLVLLNREMEKGADANPLIVENAERLKQQAVSRIEATVASVDAARSESPAVRMTALEPLSRVAGGASDVVDNGTAHSIDSIPSLPAASPTAAPRDAPVRVHRDADGKIIPAFKLDRRAVPRKPSELPKLSEIAEEYFEERAVKLGANGKDLKTARGRMAVFYDLIGDHPVDTYVPADLQAFIALMTHWPADDKHRPKDKTAREILAANADLNFKPMKRSTFEDGYIAIIRSIIRSRVTDLGYPDPIAGARLRYPATAAPRQPYEPLSFEKLGQVFRTGVAGGLLDEAMVPLLGNLTGRRLGLLSFLQGDDIREKYKGVFVAHTTGIVLDSDTGIWKRVPIKTDQSATFFVLHDFLKEIGFVDWAMSQGERFLFPALTNLNDPSKSASSYMQRLFRKAGIKGDRQEVFHSLRGGHIDFMRDSKIDPRDRRIQAGHKLQQEHDIYGFKVITELRAREIAHAPLPGEVDYSMFRNLDFERLAAARRTRGRRPKRKE